MMSLKEFTRAQVAATGRLDRMFGNYPVVRRTSELAGPLRPPGPVTELRPSLAQRLLLCIPLVFALLFSLPLLRLLGAPEVPALLPLGGLLFLCFIVWVLLWYGFLNPRYHFRIRLDAMGISVRGQQWPWRALRDTAVLTRMEGRYRNVVLVLFPESGAAEKFDLYYFGIAPRRLASLVEYYRQQARGEA